MIILDTNVISELMKEQPDPQVKQWIGSQKPQNLALTAIAIAEITRGFVSFAQKQTASQLRTEFFSLCSRGLWGTYLSF